MWPNLRAKINAPVFLIALLCSFAACCYAGRQCAKTNPFQNFRRFHESISAVTYFYPTVSQMISIVKPSLDAGKKVVIVDGNSVAFGRDQGENLWTDKLQAKLGADYKVVNFAQLGMRMFTGPYIAFLCLARKYKTIYYIGIGDNLYISQIEEPFGGYPYWHDAYYKGLIPHYRNVEEAMNERQYFNSMNGKDSTEYEIGSYLDSIFYFRDLWTTVGYNSFFTVWTKHTAPTFWKARKEYLDEDPPQQPIERRFKDIDLREANDRMTLFFKFFFLHDTANDRWSTPADVYLKFYERTARATVPEELRSRVMPISVRNNPYYVKRALTENERDCVELLPILQYKIWTKIGCSELDAGKNYQDEDYLDGWHLSSSGGAKLADEVHPKILEMAKIKNPY